MTTASANFSRADALNLIYPKTHWKWWFKNEDFGKYIVSPNNFYPKFNFLEKDWRYKSLLYDHRSKKPQMFILTLGNGRSSRSRMFLKTRNIHTKTRVLESLLAVACNAIKKRLLRRYFPVNIAKFLVTLFYRTRLVAASIKVVLGAVFQQC